MANARTGHRLGLSHVTRSALLAVVVASRVTAADEIELQPVERWSAVFAETSAKWSYRAASDAAFRERAAWRLSAEQRTLASGEVDVQGDRDKSAQFNIPLRFPSVKEGVVLDLQLSVTIGEVKHVKPVWVFPLDPFANRREWLRELKLTVFDPEGDTIKQFEASEIPHERVRQRDALDDVREGIVVIGERTSLTKHDGLIDDLQSLAVRGVPVLCLSSEMGRFEWPGKAAPIGSVSLRRSDIIREIDKQLDGVSWPPGKSPHSRGLIVTAHQDDVVAEVSEEKTAWPWCEWTFAGESAQPTRLIWCGFDLIESWESGPIPRYLFVRILERLAPRN